MRRGRKRLKRGREEESHKSTAAFICFEKSYSVATRLSLRSGSPLLAAIRTLPCRAYSDGGEKGNREKRGGNPDIEGGDLLSSLDLSL